jgi:hypothetical protein
VYISSAGRFVCFYSKNKKEKHSASGKKQRFPQAVPHGGHLLSEMANRPRIPHICPRVSPQTEGGLAPRLKSRFQRFYG